MTITFPMQAFQIVFSIHKTYYKTFLKPQIKQADQPIR